MTRDTISPAAPGSHTPLTVILVDGWIQCVKCSCSDIVKPTTYNWAETHFEGSFEDGWKVLEALVKSQSRPAPAPQVEGGEGA